MFLRKWMRQAGLGAQVRQVRVRPGLWGRGRPRLPGPGLGDQKGLQPRAGGAQVSFSIM